MLLTDTAREILTAAARNSSGAALLPDRLPIVAQRVVVRSMLKARLLEEVAASEDLPVWRAAEDGQGFSLRITAAGLAAVSAPSPETAIIAMAPRASAVQARVSVQMAAKALLAVWDSSGQPGLAHAVQVLRAALAPRSLDRSSAPRQPRPDTKRAAVLTLLRRPEGATAAQLVEATGWARHTVHGFLAGLKKGGTNVAVLERVRQAGAGQGAKGSYTVYHVVEAG